MCIKIHVLELASANRHHTPISGQPVSVLIYMNLSRLSDQAVCVGAASTP